MTQVENNRVPGIQKRWWLEWEAGVLALVVGAIYLSALGAPPLGGEESARGQIAKEMAMHDDWVVPRMQGVPIVCYYPPVHNWVIAAVARVRGTLDEVAIRLPSALAVLLMALLIYGYSRVFLSRLGAFAAASAFATMGHVLQLGRIGETDALYTVFVAGSLLVWHWIDVRRGSALAAWCIGYGLAALGMLAKGAQAPVYFVGGVGMFLLLTGRWREVFRWQQFAGLTLCVAAYLVWIIPYYLRAGAENTWIMFDGHLPGGAWGYANVSSSGMAWIPFIGMTGVPRWFLVIKHLFTFPVEVAACMLPWSILLLAYTGRAFRRSIGPAREHVRFLCCAIGVALLSCWISPGARTRHFASLYPCFAPLIGLVVDRCAYGLVGQVNLWQRFLRGMGCVMPLCGAAVFTATRFGWGPFGSMQCPLWATVLMLSGAALAAVAFWASTPGGAFRQSLGVLSVTAFLGLGTTGAYRSVLVGLGEPIAENIAALKQQLPAGARLVSIGRVDSNFVFYYGEPIRLIEPGELAAASATDWSYFCAQRDLPQSDRDFPHEDLAVISCKGLRSGKSGSAVVVGRRLPAMGQMSQRPGSPGYQ
jgi:4-amino-4-deoxy-L-arabinose transferase-like glycosyltransferase